MSERDALVRRHQPKLPPAVSHPPRGPQVTGQNRRGFGAVAQLAAVHRTLRRGAIVRVHAEGATAADPARLSDRPTSELRALADGPPREHKVQSSSPGPTQVKALATIADSRRPASAGEGSTTAAGDAGVIQRVTYAYTDADHGYPPGVPPAFKDQRVQRLDHHRAAIPNAVKDAVDAFGDNVTPPVTYNHHVAYATILGRLIGHCEGETRETIVNTMTFLCNEVGTHVDDFGLAPLSNVAAFNAWLTSAVVAICDWPVNIFRGPSLHGDPDHPAPAHPHYVALSARLTEARNFLTNV